jgi:hypothetical protein
MRQVQIILRAENISDQEQGMKLKKTIVVLGVFVIIGLMGCYVSAPQQEETGSSEQSVVDILLSGSITKKKAELSGLAWLGDTLILLPQYPEKFGPNEGALFAIQKQTILDYLDGKSMGPITPYKITLSAPGLKDSIQGYEGFESIAFWNQNIYLTIESGKKSDMMGYLVSGTVSTDLKEIILDTSHVVKIRPPIQMDNRTDEALVITENKIFTFFEINGVDLNPKPAAHVFSLDLTPQGTISFPNLEYRVTDAALGPNGEIWVINNLSPKDPELFTQFDPLIEKYNGGTPPVVDVQQVERLVKLNFSTGGITLTNDPLIQIALDKSPRNWEGLVLLDNRGFLLVTDEHPDTMLGFLPMP